MASNITAIDFAIDNNRTTHASEWIGVNKNYPTTRNSKPYIGVSDSKRQLEVLSVLPHFQHDYFPPPTPKLTVAQFAARLLPEIIGIFPDKMD